MRNDGTLLFTGDQFHVKENYTKKTPQGLSNNLYGMQLITITGLLGRDRNAWYQSTLYIERLEVVLGAKIVFGHDMEAFKALKQVPEFYC